MLPAFEQNLLRIISFQWHFFLQRLRGFPVTHKRFSELLGYPLDLDNPVTFNHKIVYRMLFDRNPFLPIIVDKYRVRDWVEKKVGAEYLIPLLDVVERTEQLKFENYGEAFVLKTNFTSGGNILVPNVSELNLDATRQKLNEWMRKKYGFEKLNWPAQKIPRRIIVEKMLQTEDGEVPYDYKFWCFNGKPKFLQVDMSRFQSHKRVILNTEWEPLAFRFNVKKTIHLDDAIPKPHNFPTMLKMTEKLSQGFDFMRVDLYSIANKIYFGELTPFPSSGGGLFDPMEADYTYGSMIPTFKKNRAGLF